MAADWTLFAWIIVSGYVAAGFLNALHRFLSDALGGKTDKLILPLDRPEAVIWSAFICSFAGPYLIVFHGLHFWRRSQLPLSGLLLCALVSLFWSFCCGILIVQLTFLLTGMR